jgi:hypothetical protein
MQPGSESDMRDASPQSVTGPGSATAERPRNTARKDLAAEELAAEQTDRRQDGYGMTADETSDK